MHGEAEVGAGHAEFTEALVIRDDAEFFERLVEIGRRWDDFTGTKLLEEGHEETKGGF